MNNKEKIKIFEASCQKLLNKDIVELNKTIDFEIEKQIRDELKEYEQKEELAYHKKIENLEKDYNKQLYYLEMQSKQDILNQKNILQKELKSEVTEILKNFTQKQEYKNFLMNRINEVIKKVGDVSTSILRIVRIDYEKYLGELYQNFQIKIETMEDSYIGGCILEDKVKGLYIDNTIKNSINEKFEGELR